MKKDILILQNSEIEGLGMLKEFMEKHSLTYDLLPIWENPKMPMTIIQYKCLIMLGGEIEIAELETNKSEILNIINLLIEDSLENNIPILSIGAGCDLVLKKIGGNSKRTSATQLGWNTIFLSNKGMNNVLFKGCPRAFPIFLYQTRKLILDDTMINLANTIKIKNQAFSYQDKVFGIRFHIEVDQTYVERLVRVVSFSRLDSQSSKIDAADIINKAPTYIKNLREIAEKIFTNFFSDVCKFKLEKDTQENTQETAQDRENEEKAETKKDAKVIEKDTENQDDKIKEDVETETVETTKTSEASEKDKQTESIVNEETNEEIS